MTGDLAIVVVNYGSHDLLRANLSWTAGGAVRVVVVDNSKSTADSAMVAALAERSGWELVALPTNAGFGAGVNRGAQRAWELGADAILIVNPDIRIGASQVEELRAALSEHPETIVSPLVVDTDGRPWGRLGRIDLKHGRLFTTDEGSGPAWLTGACLGVGKDAWLALGGMDPDYFMYWEDVDLSVRAERRGIALRLLEDVVVVHDVGGTQSTSVGKSATHYYYNCRNRLLFAAKCLTRRQLLRWVALSPAEVRRVITRGHPPSRWFRLRRALPPALRGSAAGIWWVLRHPNASKVQLERTVRPCGR